MPVMNSETSLLNLTPTSTARRSPESVTEGTVVGFQTAVQGQMPAPIVTATPPLAVSVLPLSSTARLRIIAEPGAPGDHTKLQLAVPCATRHVAPLSTDTSTLATAPPPLSVATPVIVTRSPLCTAPPVGDVTADAGASTSGCALA